jgi:hypothetical protein
MQFARKILCENKIVFRLLVRDVIPILLILVTLMMEALCSSETSVHTGATRCNIS